MPTDIRSAWPSFALTDVFDIRSGLSKPASEFGAGFPFVTFKNVLDNYFLPETLGSLVRSSETERELCDVRRGDVFLTRTSETQEDLGMSSVALRDYEGATFNGFTKRLRPKNTHQIVPEYVAYYLRSPQFRSEMNAFSSLSTRASLNNDMLSRLTITLPDRKTQEEIGYTLRALDDKIEQNRRTSQALEELAQATFKAWFVDFEPVKAKAAGQTSFPSIPPAAFATLPDRLAESLLGPVPQGWEVRPLSKVAHFLNGLALQKYPPVGDGTDLPVIKIAELRRGSTNGSALANAGVPNDYIVDDGDLLFSWSGTLEVELWFGGRGALNQHLFKVTSDTYPRWLCLHWARQHLPEFRLIASSKATTMGHIKRGHLDAALVAVPDTATLKAADGIIQPLYALYASYALETRKLAALRDYLLPRLLSGQARVRPYKTEVSS
jgi:type I restriction enzyme S subunit